MYSMRGVIETFNRSFSTSNTISLLKLSIFPYVGIRKPFVPVHLKYSILESCDFRSYPLELYITILRIGEISDMKKTKGLENI